MPYTASGTWHAIYSKRDVACYIQQAGRGMLYTASGTWHAIYSKRDVACYIQQAGRGMLYVTSIEESMYDKTEVIFSRFASGVQGKACLLRILCCSGRFWKSSTNICCLWQ